MIQFFVEMFIIRNSHRSSGKGFNDVEFLRRYVVRTCMKVFVSVCLFLVYLVGKRTIVLSHDEHIKKGERIILFNLHCEFDMIVLAIDVI